MKGRLDMIMQIRKRATLTSPDRHPIMATVPVTGPVLWFDVHGAPHRVIGFALSEQCPAGLSHSYPIIDMSYDMPKVDWETRHVETLGFRNIHFGEVPLEDVEDNFDVYRKFVNCLEPWERYKNSIQELGLNIINNRYNV